MFCRRPLILRFDENWVDEWRQLCPDDRPFQEKLYEWEADGIVDSEFEQNWYERVGVVFRQNNKSLVYHD